MSPVPVERVEVHLTGQQRRRLSYLRRLGRHPEADIEEAEYSRDATRKAAEARRGGRQVQLAKGAAA